MKTFVTTALLATFLLAGESAFGAQISIGIQIGPPPPPRVVYVAPIRPAPEFVWINGYWYPSEKHYKWREGYWVRPPYPQAVWVMPRYAEGRYFQGYWHSRPQVIVHDNGKSNGKGKSNNGRGRGHNR